jgi:hypothetical protein
MENAKDEGEGEGEEKEQRLAVETAEAGGELLSTVHMQSEQWWRMQKTKEKGKGKGKRKNSGWRWRPVVKGSCSPLMDDGPSFFPLFLLFSFSLSTKIKQMKNVAKTTRNSFSETEF